MGIRVRKGQRKKTSRTTAPAQKRRRETRKADADSLRVLWYTDTHFPHHDPYQVERLEDQIQSEQFDIIGMGGDGIDAYSVSKYDKDPSRIDTLQLELDLLGSHLRRVRDWQPNARRIYTPGNHEARIPNYVRGKAPGLDSLRCLKLPELLQTSKYGWELTPHTGVVVNETRLKHGSKVAQGAGNSVRKEMMDHWRNVAMGHCHRRATIRVRKDDREFTGVEGGGLMRLDPEYLDNPDWQQGWHVLTLHNDGRMETEEIVV